METQPVGDHGRASYDIVIVGAGPSGLCFAASLGDTPLRIALLDGLAQASLADPAYDGREIALTRRSVKLLRELGIWQRLPPGEVAALRGARVFNGRSLTSLDLQPGAAAPTDIGYLVSNHLIRRAAYEQMRELPGVTLLSGSRVLSVTAGVQEARVRLADGRELSAALVVAADSRFSATRRALGIAATSKDFGKTMLVCRMQHEVPHQRIAWEWFAHHQTLALLPLPGDCSSVVLTLPHSDIERLQQLPREAFECEMQQRFLQRLGRMRLASERFAYPLVAVYASRFVARRYAAIGDAAVGMHPVTAHGFNFGLSGQNTLAGLIRRAHRRAEDIAADGLLSRYEQAHRLSTLPLYLATNAIVRLYTDESPPARLLRSALLHLASRIPPIGSSLSRLLMQDGAGLQRFLPFDARSHTR